MNIFSKIIVQHNLKQFDVGYVIFLNIFSRFLYLKKYSHFYLRLYLKYSRCRYSEVVNHLMLLLQFSSCSLGHE